MESKDIRRNSLSIPTVNGLRHFSRGSLPSDKIKDVVKQLQDSKRVCFKSWKNVLALSIGWLLLYTSYFPMLGIQSSMNDNEGMGTMSLMVLNTVEMFGNLVLSNLIIFKVGSKWSIVIGMLLMSTYAAANFYPTWATLTPMAGLAGFGVSLTWIAQNTYLTKISLYYAANIVDCDFDTINIRFFGTFYAIYSCCNVVGNIASSFILGVTSGNQHNKTKPYDPMEICGYGYCNEDLGVSFYNNLQHQQEYSSTPKYIFNGSADGNSLAASFYKVHQQINDEVQGAGLDHDRVYYLCTFCLFAALIAALIATLFVDSLPSLNIDNDNDEEFSWKQVTTTFQHLSNSNQLLLLPLTFYNGLDNDFLYSEFTKAFVTCPFGIEYIGFVTACFGVMGPIMSFFCGWVSSKHTRAIPFVIAGFAHISCCIIMLYWKPVPGNDIPIYSLSSFWGVGTGIWCSQLTAYYGIIFPNDLEAAFSNFHLWNSIGSMLLYGASHYVCTRLKIYFMIAVLSFGLLGYTTVLLRRRREKLQKKTNLSNVNLNINKPATLVKFNQDTDI